LPSRRAGERYCCQRLRPVGRERETLRAGEQTVTYVIAEPCVDVLDKACIEECPVDCIYEGGRMLYIHPDECVDCGACEPVCPVEAIYYEDDVPEEWTAYTKANADFFEELGSPGGAAKVGKVNRDIEPVTSLPPQGE
jgi:NAD-dependent dihydropyrimidine dehydrogenase PreA subunit